MEQWHTYGHGPLSNNNFGFSYIRSHIFGKFLDVPARARTRTRTRPASSGAAAAAGFFDVYHFIHYLGKKKDASAALFIDLRGI